MFFCINQLYNEQLFENNMYYLYNEKILKINLI